MEKPAVLRGGRKQVPPLRSMIRIANHAAPVGMKEPFNCHNILQSSVGVPERFGLVFRGGPIELEQMDSADPPLGLHGIYRGRHR